MLKLTILPKNQGKIILVTSSMILIPSGFWLLASPLKKRLIQQALIIHYLP
ncbi:hypothetical protein [Okeania sp.]|uniref:hypothetical protein n=1 Tax=Okeania sp. TaxID=3100323 RepID=UPI002B4B3D45|nr:hypothetical protein [Okeania sp.]